MIIEDAKRVLGLLSRIHLLGEEMATLAGQSEIGLRLSTTQGPGKTTIAELAGEIGTVSRFSSGASHAFYMGMSPWTHQSGQILRTKSPRQINTRCRAVMMTAVSPPHPLCTTGQSVPLLQAR